MRGFVWIDIETSRARTCTVADFDFVLIFLYVQTFSHVQTVHQDAYDDV